MERRIWLGLLALWMGAVLIAGGALLAGRPAGAVAVEGAAAPWEAEASGTTLEEVIRLHVVANSDSAEDQALKRAVRDAILAEVTPLFGQAISVAEARQQIALAIPDIERIAEGVLLAQGKADPVHATFGRFDFPGNAYGALFLPAGQYMALRVAIGEAQGANWWCVLFPPLCFADWSAGVVLEPKPGTGGKETVTVPRAQLIRLLDEERLGELPVKGRSAILQWLGPKRLRNTRLGDN